MAITTVIAATKSAVVAGVATQFVTTSPFVLYGDDFGVTENARLLRLGPSGLFKDATNEKGYIEVSAFPNFVYVDIPGTYQIKKTATDALASVGYEELP